jgi:hypothetical protein
MKEDTKNANRPRQGMLEYSNDASDYQFVTRGNHLAQAVPAERTSIEPIENSGFGIMVKMSVIKHLKKKTTFFFKKKYN